jgi:hypothetical protein
VIVAGCLTALVLGLALAYPLLVSDLPVTKKVDLGVNVVYAYFGSPNVGANISGLWRNYSLSNEVVDVNGGRWGFDVNVVSYLIVLNVTNHSNDEAYITSFQLIVGPQISMGKDGSVQAGNALVNDYRNVEYYPGWGNIWSANTSRLIFLSGVIGVHDISYSSLNNSINLFARVDGQAWGGEKAQFVGYDLKQVKLDPFGCTYLYNNLVSGNQTLIFYNGFDVSIGMRQPS